MWFAMIVASTNVIFVPFVCPELESGANLKISTCCGTGRNRAALNRPRGRKNLVRTFDHFAAGRDNRRSATAA